MPYNMIIMDTGYTNYKKDAFENIRLTNSIKIESYLCL